MRVWALRRGTVFSRWPPRCSRLKQRSNSGHSENAIFERFEPATALFMGFRTATGETSAKEGRRGIQETARASARSRGARVRLLGDRRRKHAAAIAVMTGRGPAQMRRRD